MNVLVISVHPDDETLGCGGTMLRHVAEGDTVDWLVVTAAYEPRWGRDLIDRKASEVSAVATAYGLRHVTKLGFRTTELDTVQQNELIDRIREAVEATRPEVVYVVHGGDVHTDHFAVFTATMSVLKPFYMRKHGVQRVLCYETLSSTEAALPLIHRVFVPNVYREITGYLDKKVEIMGLYASELHPDPLPRGGEAIRALARYRGATIAVESAEAFVLVREVT